MKFTGKLKTSPRAFAAFAALAVFFCLYVAGLFVFNAFYNEIFDTPRVIEGEADYKDASFDGRMTAFTLSGEWEFYYNRWIITDGYDGESDGYISVPARWTGREKDGEKLSRFGYASYKMTVKNMKEGTLLTTFTDNSAAPLRIFINGELSSVCGTVSKTSEGSVSGQSEKVGRYIADGGDAIVVIETGYLTNGGLTHAPCLSCTLKPSGFWAGIEKFTVIMAGLTAAMFLSSLTMFFGFYRYQKSVTLPLVTGALCLHFFFSKDLTKALGLYGYGSVFVPALVSGIFTALFFAAHILKLCGALNVKSAIAGLAASAVLCAVFGALYGTVYTVIPSLLFLFAALLPLFPFLSSAKVPQKYKIAYAAIYYVTVCILAFEAIDGAGVLSFGMEYFFAFILTAIIAAQCLTAFIQLCEQSEKLLRMKELESELETARQRALSFQIKPHFVFNSLTAIQSLYHRDLDEGDRALKSFSSHLRLNINAADGRELIPFESEVKNVLNYFELENLRADGALTLLLDVAETNFSVPVLSIQPLVENAVKYAGTQTIKDGYISLSSERAENSYLIKVTDNGVGFAAENAEFGVGIKNAKERLFRLVGGELEIKSKPGEGTEIIITLPAKENANENGCD